MALRCRRRRLQGNCNAIDRWVTQWFGEVPAGCPDIRNPSNPSSWVGMKWPNGGGFVPLVITE